MQSIRLTAEPIIYTVPQAAREAVDILEEEANQLAKFDSALVPHRVQISILREMQRLRSIANALKP